LLKLLTHFMKILGASFCILEPGWARRSRTDEDIEKWLHDINQGIPRDWELVVIEDLSRDRRFLILPNQTLFSRNPATIEIEFV